MTATEAPPVLDAQAFRSRVAAFLLAKVPLIPPGANPPIDTNSPARVTWVRSYQAQLFDAGLAGISWPVQYGGQGLPTSYEGIFQAEAATYAVPVRGVVSVGLGMCGPTLLAEGTESQKRRYLPRLLRGDEIWCQLFSEPEAGSDVASLRCRAEWNGSGWTLNGQKVWSSMAHFADFGLLVARTDPTAAKHAGISMFVLDMRLPGVTVRPLRQMSGASDFNEVFLEDVHVSEDCIVGELNRGWKAAITTLMNERVSTSGGRAGVVDRVTELIELSRQRGLSTDPLLRQRLADLYICQRVLGFIQMRAREGREAGRPPGPEGSISKLWNARLANVAGSLAVHIAGPASMAWSSSDDVGRRWAKAVTEAPARRIAGGTDEIQRNILGERILGLPRDR